MKKLSLSKLEKIKEKLTKISFSSIEAKYKSKKILAQIEIHTSVLDAMKKDLLDQDLLQFEQKRVKLIEDDKSGTITHEQFLKEFDELNSENPEFAKRMSAIYIEYEAFSNKVRVFDIDSLSIDDLPDSLEIQDMGALIEIID